MRTKIYISRKLESVVPKSLINIEKMDSQNPLDKWTATLFYVSRKKCLLITNSTTRYSILLDRFKTSDFTELSKIFAKILYKQLLTDDIEIDLETALKMVGQVDLFSTDNDKKIIGTQNSILVYIEDWKYEFGHIDNWPFLEINSRINRIPYKQLGWLFPKEKMKLTLNTISTSV